MVVVVEMVLVLPQLSLMCCWCLPLKLVFSFRSSCPRPADAPYLLLRDAFGVKVTKTFAASSRDEMSPISVRTATQVLNRPMVSPPRKEFPR